VVLNIFYTSNSDKKGRERKKVEVRQMIGHKTPVKKTLITPNQRIMQLTSSAATGSPRRKTVGALS
jgi:hypothetical protein